MKEKLKRELNKTYLILSSEGCEYEESYEIEMLMKNSLETILPIHALRIDGNVELYYDISSKQTQLPEHRHKESRHFHTLA